MADTPQEPADTLHRHGEPDPSQWDKADTVTQRPNDLVDGKVSNTTFGDRSKSAKPVDTKAVEEDEADNKAVKSSRTAKK